MFGIHSEFFCSVHEHFLVESIQKLSHRIPSVTFSVNWYKNFLTRSVQKVLCQFILPPTFITKWYNELFSGVSNKYICHLMNNCRWWLSSRKKSWTLQRKFWLWPTNTGEWLSIIIVLKLDLRFIIVLKSDLRFEIEIKIKLNFSELWQSS